MMAEVEPHVSVVNSRLSVPPFLGRIFDQIISWSDQPMQITSDQGRSEFEFWISGKGLVNYIEPRSGSWRNGKAVANRCRVRGHRGLSSSYIFKEPRLFIFALENYETVIYFTYKI